MQLPARVQRQIEWFQQSKLGQFLGIYGEREVPAWAVVIAYSTMFAMFPLLLAIFAIVGLLLRDPAVFDALLAHVRVALPGDSADAVAEAALAAQRAAGAIGIVGLAGLIWAGSGLFVAIAHAFNQIYGVEDRDLLHQRLMGAIMIFVFAVFLLLSLAATSAAQFAFELTTSFLGAGGPLVTVLSGVLSLAVSLVLALVLFLAIHWIVPNIRLGIKQVLPGAILGAAGFVAISQVFPLYGRYFTKYRTQMTGRAARPAGCWR